MKILESICEKNCYLPMFIEKLTQPNFPVIIYGKGPYAKMVYDELTKNGVRISNICGDKDFIAAGSTFEGYPITDLTETVKKYKNVNVVIGFGIYRDVPQDNLRDWFKIASSRIKKLSDSVNEVYYFDFFWKYDYNFVVEHASALQNVCNSFEDQLSRETFTAFWNQRISGKMDYITNVCVKDIYFPTDIIKLDEGEIYVDCGAYDGDSVIPFIDRCKKEEKKYNGIIAFEPDKKNVEKFQNKILSKAMPNVQLVPKATWSSATQLKFKGGNQTSSCLSDDGDIIMETESIDHVLSGSKVTFIKLDVEGAELETLKGAENSIKAFRPKLAISIYHKQDDFITIPQYIHKLVPEYKFYLRAHVGDTSDVVLYAVI